MKKLKIKNQDKFENTLIIILTILFLYIILGLSLLKPKVKYVEYKYTVQTGDTLWQLARQNINNKVNIQEYIYTIEKINNCNANLQIGQEITLLKVVD